MNNSPLVIPPDGRLTHCTVYVNGDAFPLVNDGPGVPVRQGDTVRLSVREGLYASILVKPPAPPSRWQRFRQWLERQR